MFWNTNPSENPPHVIRETIAINSPFKTGGLLVDKALELWFGWQDGQAGLPDWSAFKPFEHPDLLAHVGVRKHVDGQYRSVVVGEAVRVRVPVKIQGELIHEALPAVNADDVIKRSNHALNERLPNYVEKTMAWIPGHEFIRYRALYLPFESAQDGISRILTVFDFETKVA